MFDPKAACEAIERQWWQGGLADAEALQALLAQRPEAFWAVERAASKHFDVRGLIAAGEALRRSGQLDMAQGTKLARALMAVDRPAEALAIFDSLQAAQSLGAKSLLHRGRALAALGRRGEAVAAFDEALAAAPGFDGADQWRQRVQAFEDLAQALRAAPSWRLASETLRAAETIRYVPGTSEMLGVLAIAGVPPTAEDSNGHVDYVLETAVSVLSAEDASRLLQLATGRAGATGMRAKLAVKHHQEAPPTRPKSFPARFWSAMATEAGGDPMASLALMDQLVRDDAEALQAKHGLAYLAGAAVRSLAGPRSASASQQPRTWNIFPFNNEFLMLRMRLEEMAWVDEFVLVEARQTFTGAEKPLHFEARKSEFAEYAHKLRHVVVDRFPDGVEAPWARDYYQRDYGALPVLEEASPDDRVLVTDVDEIVDRESLIDFRGDIARLEMNTFRYFLNFRPTRDNLKERIGRTGVVCSAADIEAHGASYLRFVVGRVRKDWPVVSGGWHFTGVGDASVVAGKFRDYAHQESRYDRMRDPAEIDRILAQIRSGAFSKRWEREPDLSVLPRFVRDNAQALSDLLL